MHRARRFFREDLADTGRIELYTIERYPGPEATSMTELGWYEATTSEDWLGYAPEGSEIEGRAAAELAQAGSLVAAAQEERFAAIELR